MEVHVKTRDKTHHGLILPGDPEYTRSPGGSILVDGRDVVSTIQCCHCGGHWTPVKGSGKRRGWCMNCKAPHCGSRECSRCIPFEAKLEAEEKAANKLRRIILG